MIYFIQYGIDGPIKIGIARNPEWRLAKLQTACPYDLRLLATILGGASQEARLHQRFAEYWIRGEWFKPARALLEFISVIQGGQPFQPKAKQLSFDMPQPCKSLPPDHQSVWQRLCVQQPALQLLFIEATVTPLEKAERAWYAEGGFSERIFSLVGWYARYPSPELITAQSYRFVHDWLYKACFKHRPEWTL